MDIEGMVTLAEAANLLNRGEKQVRRYIKQERLPAQLIGKQYFIKRSDIMAFFQQYLRIDFDTATTHEEQDTVSSLDNVQVATREQMQALASHLAYQDTVIEKLQQELEAMQTRMSTLEQGPARSKQPAPRRDAKERPKDTANPQEEPVRQESTTSTRPTLPVSWSSWTPFIERHGVNSESHRLQKATNRADYCEPGEYMQPSKSGKTLVKCALSPDGQARLLTAIRALPIGASLRPCEVEACPCHEIIEA